MTLIEEDPLRGLLFNHEEIHEMISTMKNVLAVRTEL